MAERQNTIGTTTGSDEIRRMFAEARSQNTQVVLDENMSSEDLLTLARRSKQEGFYSVLVDLIIAHRAVDVGVLLELLRECRSPQTLNAIATSGKAPVSVLQVLRRSEFASVRDHATLALLRPEMAYASAERIQDILAEHQGEGGVDIGVRILVASHPRTPLEDRKSTRLNSSH